MEAATALVVEWRWSEMRIARVNRRAAGQGCMRERRTAVVLQRAKQRIGIDLIARACQVTAAVIATDVVSMRREGTAVVENVFARRSSVMLGSAWAFAAAVLVILVWLLTGPMFHFSDTWQLIINTATTVVTFLMVFLIQNTQNRDAKAVHLKLDELIRAIKDARNELVDLEDLSDEELKKLEDQFRRMRTRAESDETSPSRHVDPVESAASPH